MELARVDLHNWPHNRSEPGGWVIPHGEPIARWHVTKVHACYKAPEIPFGATDASGRPVRSRGERRAYLVDLSGEGWGLDDCERVLLYQTEPNGMWALKTVNEEYLAGIAGSRVQD